MKKQQLILGLGASALVFGLFAPTAAHALKVDGADTDATVKFDEGKIVPPGGPDPALIKPGTASDYIYVDPADGKRTNGPLRFSNVPNIKFGSVAIKVGTTNYESLISAYKPSDGKTIPATTVKAVNIPHFAQVVDERGVDGQFEVKVTATEFAQKDAPTKKLPNTRVQIKNNTLRNNKVDNAAAGNKDGNASTLLEATGLAADTAKSISSTAISVLKVKTAQNANATVSSVVFGKGYTSTTDYSTKTTNPDIQLNVPMGEQPEKLKEYKATLTWELTDAK